MKTKTGYSYGWCFTGSLTSNLHIAVKNKQVHISTVQGIIKHWDLPILAKVNFKVKM